MLDARDIGSEEESEQNGHRTGKMSVSQVLPLASW